MTVADAKTRLRAEIRATRAARTDDARAMASSALAPHALSLLPAAPSRVSAYLSLNTEPGTDALLAALHAAGHRALVPRIVGRELEWVPVLADSKFTRGPLGIREPTGSAVDTTALATLDAIFLPGLAVDRDGRRLGQGGGYYDRTLATVPAHADGGPLRVMLLFDDEVRHDVPAEPHDCTVDAAVTPSGVVWFAPKPLGAQA